MPKHDAQSGPQETQCIVWGSSGKEQMLSAKCVFDLGGSDCERSIYLFPLYINIHPAGKKIALP